MASGSGWMAPMVGLFSRAREVNNRAPASVQAKSARVIASLDTKSAAEPADENAPPSSSTTSTPIVGLFSKTININHAPQTQENGFDHKKKAPAARRQPRGIFFSPKKFPILSYPILSYPILSHPTPFF